MKKLTKDQQKDEALKAYLAIDRPAWKAYDAIQKPAFKAYRAKLVEIDARPPEEIITVGGRKYKLMGGE